MSGDKGWFTEGDQRRSLWGDGVWGQTWMNIDRRWLYKVLWEDKTEKECET